MSNLKFNELALSNELQEAIAEMGFDTATPIQSEAIPHIMEGKDLIGQAQTGTGKTAAFGIPLIELINSKERNVQAVVMCPTRELAVQVANELKKLLKYKKGITSLAVYGGESIEKQIGALKRGVHIVIGTPGRIIDHLDRGTLSFEQVKMVVLDEADEMLNMGFRDDIESILKDMPSEKQTIFFSATMPKPIMELTKRYQKNPVLVKITKTELTNVNIEQCYFDVKSDQRISVMCNLIDTHSLQLMLVFCNTKRGVDEVVEELISTGYKAEGIHGDLKQNQRNNVMAKFRSGKVNILVATDVAARGIDVDNVDAVFNFDVPLDVEYYVHRIGRTARAGKSGKAFTFVTGRNDAGRLRDIEQYTKVRIEKAKAPSSKDLMEIKKSKMTIKLAELMSGTADLSLYKSYLDELLAQGHSAEDVATVLLRVQLGELKEEKAREERPSRDRYEKGGDDRRNGSGRERGERVRSERRESSSDREDRNSRERRPRKSSSGMVRLFVNVGRMDRVSPGDIVGAFTNEANIDSSDIGQIEIFDKYTFVEVGQGSVDNIMDGLSNAKIKGRKVNIELANGRT